MNILLGALILILFPLYFEFGGTRDSNNTILREILVTKLDWKNFKQKEKELNKVGEVFPGEIVPMWVCVLRH